MRQPKVRLAAPAEQQRRELERKQVEASNGRVVLEYRTVVGRVEVLTDDLTPAEIVGGNRGYVNKPK